MKSGTLQDEAEQDRARKEAIDHRDPVLGGEHRVAQGSTGAVLAESRGEHRQGGQRSPRDAKRARLRVVLREKHEAGLNQQIQS